MTYPDLTVRPVADLMLACLTQEVAGLDNPPQQTCLRAGAVVNPDLSLYEDECCSGLAWVRVAGLFPTETFPVPAGPSNCGPFGWAVTLELGIVRCAPTPGPGEMISCTAWTDLAYQLMDDMSALRRTLCCFGLADPDRLYVVDSVTPLPVGGRCAGTTMTVTVQAPDCDCDDDEVMS